MAYNLTERFDDAMMSVFSPDHDSDLVEDMMSVHYALRHPSMYEYVDPEGIIGDVNEHEPLQWEMVRVSGWLEDEETGTEYAVDERPMVYTGVTLRQDQVMASFYEVGIYTPYTASIGSVAMQSLSRES